MQIVISGHHVQRFLVLLAIAASIAYVTIHPDVLAPAMHFLKGLKLV